MQNALEVFRRLLKIKRAVKLHRHDILGIHEGEAEEIGHQTGGEVFAAARNVVNREVGERFAESAELFLNGRIEAELVLNLQKPPLNQIKDGLAVHVIFNMGAAEVERRDGSASMMALTLRNCSAEAQLLPPNFVILSMIRESVGFRVRVERP